jgi:predicted cobalt transporter CbtA
MPTQVAKVDASGSAVLDKDGKPVMIANAARNIWVTATTLTTALNLGIMAYALSGFAVLFGLVLIWAGLVASALSRRY